MPSEFSVIIPTYGRAELLGEAVASVLRQTFVDFECIVVDDASPDAPVLPSDGRVRLIERERNGGPAAARNSGIAAATGRYLAFLDDDDLWLPDRLALAAEAHRRAPVAVCWQATLGSNKKPLCRILEGDVSDTVLDTTAPQLGATSIERAVAPTFDERYGACEDLEWLLRVAQGLLFATITSVGFLYRAHDGTRTHASQRTGLGGVEMLLAEHDDWFKTHPRSKAFRLKRMGLSALAFDDRKSARRCFATSLRLHPEPRTAWHALRTFAPHRRSP
jgi:glycosyltransferase involved in cell wall biosynthesis